MYPKPRILQQVIGVIAGHRLAPEITQKGGTDRRDEDSRRRGVASLIAFHPPVKLRGGALRFGVHFSFGPVWENRHYSNI